ncbi:unnamed protein product [Cuscuta epithymum]|uniref:Uncharacterized protein n=1 Tax=Cuscuta epithymum TaxID=186058 RepID=A0AAV0EDZ3_9ASTE|nr:unnamed protein product [Cuscuta epithymum]
MEEGSNSVTIGGDVDPAVVIAKLGKRGKKAQLAAAAGSLASNKDDASGVSSTVGKQTKMVQQLQPQPPPQLPKAGDLPPLQKSPQQVMKAPQSTSTIPFPCPSVPTLQKSSEPATDRGAAGSSNGVSSEIEKQMKKVRQLLLPQPLPPKGEDLPLLQKSPEWVMKAPQCTSSGVGAPNPNPAQESLKLDLPGDCGRTKPIPCPSMPPLRKRFVPATDCGAAGQTLIGNGSQHASGITIGASGGGGSVPVASTAQGQIPMGKRAQMRNIPMACVPPPPPALPPSSGGCAKRLGDSAGNPHLPKAGDMGPKGEEGKGSGHFQGVYGIGWYNQEVATPPHVYDVPPLEASSFSNSHPLYHKPDPYYSYFSDENATNCYVM